MVKCLSTMWETQVQSLGWEEHLEKEMASTPVLLPGKSHGQRFMTLYRRQGPRPSPRKRNAKRQMAVWGGLTNSCEKKRSERQRRKEKIYLFECRVPKNSKERDKKAFLSDQ